ncbi:YlxR family protein [Ornithinibacillus sp. BX22]|uniref:YlxR family protein n=2 Tax=Ornithinibacillus TaxID=484508 RepID=A0A923L414_9BACI|nr:MULTISPECIES: YlxR family protein [Ornithinibacillus]MBC5636001.1 YlxR family protein [Ornithinibacillus hominis]MBS3680010.1 YlxR family protein [Ornithinibacillus massiliensis]
MVAKRKTPERKCVVTNEMKPKKELIRVVRNKDGEVFVDATGKKNGRGAYLTKDLEVINKAEKTGVLSKHLNVQIDESIYEELRASISDNHEK